MSFISAYIQEITNEKQRNGEINSIVVSTSVAYRTQLRVVVKYSATMNARWLINDASLRFRTFRLLCDLRTVCPLPVARPGETGFDV